MGTIIATIAFGVALAFIIGFCLSQKEDKVQMPKEEKTVKTVAKKAPVKKAVASKKAVSTKATKKVAKKK